MKSYIFAGSILFALPTVSLAGVAGAGGGGSIATELQVFASDVEQLNQFKANLNEGNFIYLKDLDLHVKTISTFQTLEGSEGVLLQALEDGSLHTVIRSLD